MTQPLFDVFRRTDTDFKKHGESLFTFLNRSSQKEFARARDLLEDWYSNFPTHCHKDIRSRIRSGHEMPFHSAFFELFLHAISVVSG